MEGRIDTRILDDIRSRIRLSDLIGNDVKLARYGTEFRGLSPFQDENTPSFTVNDTKGFWHCFSSKKHGDHFQWLQDYKGMAFRDAVKALADVARIALPEPTAVSTGRLPCRAAASAACAAAASYWRGQLSAQVEGRAARDYLAGRGLDQAEVSALGLGWAPHSSRGLFEALRKKGVGRKAMSDAGLLSLVHDGAGFFRERIIFPITDQRGTVIGFGGRRIGVGTGDGPKYLNSRETVLFKKREALYGLDVAMPAAARRGRIIVVEGYTDRIAMARAGFAETIAVQGSTVDFAVLRRLLPKVAQRVILFDGDRAGKAAYDRMIDHALLDAAPGCVTKFANLTTGEDPDSYLKGHGSAEMETIIAGAIGLEEALWRRTIARCGGDLGPEGRSAVVGELIRCADMIVHSETKAWFHTTLASRVVSEFGARRHLREVL
ncbi:hypothetical protein GCM10007874_10630 [Labrys miyagiensis]|uniref:Toprim domain-containing protein n=1 Tax=Labrys miyagiensis TaxID=346912 RepID=A0ABQ6CCG9_9HYPH|nr:DNA primase [Labrys miyagiensis]GLS18047.1 hypothetical protein GCM10007874_10630 [Labrys miyagiensis]